MSTAVTQTHREVAPFEKAKAFFNDPALKTQMQLALPKHMTADRMLRVGLTAMLGNPKLLEAVSHPNGKAALAKAMLQASQLGLEVDGRQAHLVPFNDRRLGMIVQLIPGYQGLVDKAYNHPKVKSIWWNVVYEKDQFRFVDGLDRTLEHMKYEGDDDPGPLRYAYAVCAMEGGNRTFVCLNRREVMKAKSCSRGADSEFSPWRTHESAMWAKTAVRALCKQIPQSGELREALRLDDELDGDLQSTRINAARFEAAKPVYNVEVGPPTQDPEPKTQEATGEEGGQSDPQPAPPQDEAKKEKAKTQETAKATKGKSAKQEPDTTETKVENPGEFLLQKCKEHGIEEIAFSQWACKTYRLSPADTISDLLEFAPARMDFIANKWSDLEAGILKACK